jgi:hypothetical protein
MRSNNPDKDIAMEDGHRKRGYQEQDGRTALKRIPDTRAEKNRQNGMKRKCHDGNQRSLDDPTAQGAR